MKRNGQRADHAERRCQRDARECDGATGRNSQKIRDGSAQEDAAQRANMPINIPACIGREDFGGRSTWVSDTVSNCRRFASRVDSPISSAM
jgi:hypothetical protein